MSARSLHYGHPKTAHDWCLFDKSYVDSSPITEGVLREFKLSAEFGYLGPSLH